MQTLYSTMMTKKLNRSESFSNSESSEKIVPPWCSSRKVCKRSKLMPKGEIQSTYPLRENIWEYLYEGNAGNFKCASKRRNREGSKQRGNYYRRKTILITFIFILLLGVLGLFWTSTTIPNTKEFMNKLISYAGNKLLTSDVLGEWKYSSVSEECCSKMKYLTLELLRTEHILRNSLRIRGNVVTATIKVTETMRTLDRQYIEGATATKGSDTREWGSRAALWGVVPLWRASPPPSTVLVLRDPTPADCWPFSGSSGELHIQLPHSQRVQSISIEHIRPDTAKSAPKHFIVYGILTNNTLIKLTENEYIGMGPSKQYYALGVKTPINNIIFRVLTNHGNVKYTCIYRVHLYGEANFNINVKQNN